MPGETSLPLLLASLRPMLDTELYTFASVDEPVLQRLGRPLAVFREAEGISVIVSLRDARALGLEARGELRRITLRVSSSLEAVGLTAAVSRVLTEAGIACNVVAATQHDHLFVPAARAEEAQAAERSTPIRYRRATIADAAVLATLGATVWIATYCDEGVPTDCAGYVLAEFSPEKIAATLGATDTVFWVAEAAEGVVGFADLRLGARTWHLAAPRQAEVSRLYLLERFTRRGIGRALLQRCHTTAGQWGATALWLTMYAGNARARAFYQALGWRKVGDWAFTLADKSYPNDVLAAPVVSDAA
jgi:ribosomal protein S18 acetylase RimI-like enzyme